jgi:hypothetical protein
MIGLAFAFVLAATPAEPRLQWEGADGVRIVNRYGGKWAMIAKDKMEQVKEHRRDKDAIDFRRDDGTEFRINDRGWWAMSCGDYKRVRTGRWVAAFPIIELSHLSEKYESGGRGPGTVSTGEGDPGGVSYGSYQLASKVGRADAFVGQYYPTGFAGLKAGTPEFTAKWMALAEKDAAGLHKNEHEYIKATHHDPQAKKLLAEIGFDVSKRNRVIQDMVWSTAVQHGPNTDVIVAAVKGKKAADLTDAELLTAVYAERGRKTPDGTKLARFQRVSDKWIPGLTRRFENELKDALAALK